MRTIISRKALILLIALGATPAFAQAPAAPADAPPPPPLTGSFGAGLSLTRGNSDTTNINLSFDTKYDPKTGYLFKAEGLYLRGRTEGADTANRLFLQGRAERGLTPHVILFAQLQYLRDTFKAIDYLVAPTAGVGYKVVDTPVTQFTVDTSVGIVAEKNPGIDVRRSGAWLAGEKLTHKLSSTATLTHSAQALWKMDDLKDGLYTISVGVAAALTPRSQLKAELLDTFKSQPPLATDKNDVALLVSVVFKY
jgi:putative salt-induced outer membrane protein YdiY